MSFNDITPAWMLAPPAIVGEAVAGESVQSRRKVEHLVNYLVGAGNFDLGDELYKIKRNHWYQDWGYSTFHEYATSLGMKRSKSQYLCRIAELMDELGIPREKYEPVGVSKLRHIAKLDPAGTWTNPETAEVTSLKDFILGFIEKGPTMTNDEVAQHVRTLRGFVGENDITWINIAVLRSALTNTVRPALECAKALIGDTGRDNEGIACEASDGRALEMISADFLSANQGELNG